MLSGSPRGWFTKYMLYSIKAGNKVLNLVPLSTFNPSIGHVVKDTVSDVVNEIPKDKTEILKEKPNDKPKGLTHKLPCVDNLKDKVSDIVKEKPKDKPKGVTDKAPCVHNVKDKVLDIVVKSRVPKDKVSNIIDNVKDKCKTELPKDKAKDKTKSVVRSKVLDVINEKRKTEVMKDKPKDKASSVVKSKLSTDLPKDKTKDKIIKGKMDTEYSNSELDSDEVDFESSALIESQKIKTKAELKRKMKGGSDSDSLSLDEEKVRKYMVANFDSETYRMSLDSGDYVEVTPSKIHDILGIAIGGDLLFSFKERPIEHDLVSYPVVVKESVDPIVQEAVVEEIAAEEYEILSTPESYTQWRLTPDRMATRASKVSLSPKKQIVKPSSYLLSPYMNKKTKVVPKITRLEFTIGNYLFAMQGDKMLTISPNVEVSNFSSPPHNEIDSKNLLDRVSSSKRRVLYHKSVRLTMLACSHYRNVSKQTTRASSSCWSQTSHTKSSGEILKPFYEKGFSKQIS
nr:ulp1 protease family, C-terminal catalytic domain-containing protein [Tanacetum cinerariifolium]